MADSTSSSMSAHLCLMAWNEPIGRPNCTRTLAYSTAISSTFWAPPTCSAARPTAARSSTVDSTSQPSPSVPMSVAGVSANSSLACLRVWSIVDSAVRVRPAASPSTANRLTPGAGAGGDDDQVGGVAVEHEHLRAGRASSRRPACVASMVMPRLVPLARRLGEGERGDRLAGGDAGQVVLLGGVVAGLEQRVGGEHDGREERRAQQRPAHLLEHDAELDVAVARAAELLGDGRPWRPICSAICVQTAGS